MARPGRRTGHLDLGTIITKRCPECENSPSYREQSDCDYGETPPEEWSKGLVGFKPTAVFDIPQTEGEPLPELEAEATGDADGLVPALEDSADDLGVTVRIVDAADPVGRLPAVAGVAEQLAEAVHDLDREIEEREAERRELRTALEVLEEYLN